MAAMACLMVLVIPYVWSMKKVRFSATEMHRAERRTMPGSFRRHAEEGKTRSTLDMPFPRSTGILIPMRSRFYFPAIWISVSEIIQFLRTNTTEDERIFVFCELQMIYYLAEQDSVVQKENYFIHLAAMGLIDHPDRVRLPDEELLKRFVEAKPRFIIQAPEGKHTKRIANVWPRAGRFIEENYRVVRRVGGIYEIMEARVLSAAPAAMR